MQLTDFAAAIAQGRREAASMDAEYGRSCASDDAISARVIECSEAIRAAEWAAEAGHCAFEAQRNLDILHARYIGQCPGCARTADLRWGHRSDCAALYMVDRASWSISFDRDGTDVIVLD